MNEKESLQIEEVRAVSVSRSAQLLLLTIFVPLLLMLCLFVISNFLVFFPFNRLYYTAPNYFLVMFCLWVSFIIKNLNSRGVYNLKLILVLICSCSLISIGADFLVSLTDNVGLGLESAEEWFGFVMFVLWQFVYFSLLFWMTEKFDFLIFKCKDENKNK